MARITPYVSGVCHSRWATSGFPHGVIERQPVQKELGLGESETFIYICRMTSITSLELLTLLLSSAVVSGLVSALLTGWFGRLTKKDEYKNGFYKLVLDRRMKSYEVVERLILSVKTAVHGEDNRLYHLAFAHEDVSMATNKLMLETMQGAMWLSDDLFSATRELNHLMFSKAKDGSWIDFGKKHYQAIAKLRIRMETLLVRDMLELHNIPAFLKRKKSDDTFLQVPDRDQSV
jgi:hypothetical protein